jgi:hypothetical protein
VDERGAGGHFAWPLARAGRRRPIKILKEHAGEEFAGEELDRAVSFFG